MVLIVSCSFNKNSPTKADRAADQTSFINSLTGKINSESSQIDNVRDKTLKLLTDAYNEQIKALHNIMGQQELRLQKKIDSANIDRVSKYPCLITAQKNYYNVLSDAEMNMKKCFINQEIYLKQKLTRSRVVSY